MGTGTENSAALLAIEPASTKAVILVSKEYRQRLEQFYSIMRYQNKKKTNLDENSKFVLFFTRDYFGLKIKL